MNWAQVSNVKFLALMILNNNMGIIILKLTIISAFILYFVIYPVENPVVFIVQKWSQKIKT